MSLERKQMRAAVVALLKASPQTGAADRVFANSSTPLDATELPCILVYPKQESAEILDEPRRYSRTVQMVISVAARQQPGDGAPAIDDVIDDICAEVEAKLYVDETIGGKASDSRLTGIEFEYAGEGSQTMGAARMTFEMDYLSEAPPDLSGDLDPLVTAAVDHDLAPPDGALEAQDEVALPQ